MASRSRYTFFASPKGAAGQPAPKNQLAHGSRYATTRGLPSGRLMSTGFKNVSPERAETTIWGSSANRLAAPLDFPAMRYSNGAPTESHSFPAANLDLIAPAETAAFAAPAPTFQENASPSPAELSIADTEEPVTQEIEIAAEPGMTNGNAEGMPVVAIQSGTEDVGIAVEVPPVAAAGEKPAATNLLAFHGLNQQPFDVTPDPAYLYFSPSHREALTSLAQGIENFRGFMMLVAEPGMGKTTLLNKLMDELSESSRVVFLFQTQCNSSELLAFILNELQVDHAGMDVVAMHRALNQALLEEMLRGRRFVLIVDEAQNLQEPVLETIRLLSDFETTHSKLIQIVLAGQPQLADTLMKSTLVQLRQRIAILSNLKPLAATEVAEYVEHRLRAAGWNGKPLFTRDAFALIAESSEGVPRNINNLCFNALLMAFHRGQEIIGADIVKEVAGKLNLEALVRHPQKGVIPHQAAAPADPDCSGTAQFTRALAAALSAEARPAMTAKAAGELKPKPGVVVTGNLTDKLRCRTGEKKNEYRIQVFFERDPLSGVAVADRYYCCEFYISEEQAATLCIGQPVRIKIEQD